MCFISPSIDFRIDTKRHKTSGAGSARWLSKANSGSDTCSLFVNSFTEFWLHLTWGRPTVTTCGSIPNTISQGYKRLPISKRLRVIDQPQADSQHDSRHLSRPQRDNRRRQAAPNQTIWNLPYNWPGWETYFSKLVLLRCTQHSKATSATLDYRLNLFDSDGLSLEVTERNRSRCHREITRQAEARPPATAFHAAVAIAAQSTVRDLLAAL